MIVHVTDLALIERMWPTMEPMFATVTRHTNGCYEPEDVLAELRTGKQSLWMAWDEKGSSIDAVMTTMFDQYPRRRTLKIVFVAGKRMKTWLRDFRELVEKHAIENGATMLEGFFREGWAKVWPGARISGVGLVKELA